MYCTRSVLVLYVLGRKSAVVGRSASNGKVAIVRSVVDTDCVIARYQHVHCTVLVPDDIACNCSGRVNPIPLTP